MNCQQFTEELYEYLDGTLSLGRAADARQHLAICSACRRALEREQATARFLNESLHEATADLSLNPPAALIVQRNSEQRQSNFFQLAWRWLTAEAIRPAGIGATFLVMMAMLFVVQRERMDSAPNRAGQAEAAVVDVPIVSASHVFQLQNDTVIDAIGSTIAVAHAGFIRNNEHRF
jgi:anti-sigma factor RsiW